MRTVKYLFVVSGYVILALVLNQIPFYEDEKVFTTLWNCLSPFAECALQSYFVYELGAHLLKIKLENKYKKFGASLLYGIASAQMSLNLFDNAHESIFRFWNPQLTDCEITDAISKGFHLYNVFSLSILSAAYVICVFTWLSNIPESRAKN